MKRQIRLNVFETNSSTQHALVIKSKYRNRTLEDGIPDGITFPEKLKLYQLNWATMDSLKLNTLENRILWLYNVALADSWDNIENLIHFFVCLQKLGVNYELFDISDNVNFYTLIPTKFIKEILGNDEHFIAFLFLDDILYDTYADDCGSWEEQCEWEDTIQKFIDKIEQPIILRERC